MLMMIARLLCNVDTSGEHERTTEGGDRANRLAPGEDAHGDRDERLGERQHRGSGRPDPAKSHDEHHARHRTDRDRARAEEGKARPRDRGKAAHREREHRHGREQRVVRHRAHGADPRREPPHDEHVAHVAERRNEPEQRAQHGAVLRRLPRLEHDDEPDQRDDRRRYRAARTRALDPGRRECDQDRRGVVRDDGDRHRRQRQRAEERDDVERVARGVQQEKADRPPIPRRPRPTQRERQQHEPHDREHDRRRRRRGHPRRTQEQAPRAPRGGSERDHDDAAEHPAHLYHGDGLHLVKL
jgi:hypothetical protein